MRRQTTPRWASAAGPAILVGAAAVAAETTEADPAAVDAAFVALKTYDWGTERETLKPIDDAVVASHGDSAARGELETRLIAVLQSDASRSAKDFVCRTLKTIGTAQSVPALAALLPNRDLSHMARYALERIPAPEAAAVMRDAVANLTGPLKVGVIGSLGVRGDATSVPVLARSLNDADQAVVVAAANALGLIGTPEAADALGARVKEGPPGTNTAVVDACLVCAERLLTGGNKAAAIAIYKSLGGEEQPRHVRLAATRGLLAAAGKK